ncbi:MAG: hypothetical protein HS111_01995 [Kofleriaceae bacterium]|nr:hypothetical protein [Kofleriaceae bacterium]
MIRATSGSAAGASPISARGGALALPPRPARPPVRVGGLTLENAVIDLMATGYWPGHRPQIITIERATAGACTLRTGLSWLFTLEELVARLDLTGRRDRPPHLPRRQAVGRRRLSARRR